MLLNSDTENTWQTRDVQSYRLIVESEARMLWRHRRNESIKTSNYGNVKCAYSKGLK